MTLDLATKFNSNKDNKACSSEPDAFGYIYPSRLDAVNLNTFKGYLEDVLDQLDTVLPSMYSSTDRVDFDGGFWREFTITYKVVELLGEDNVAVQNLTSFIHAQTVSTSLLQDIADNLFHKLVDEGKVKLNDRSNVSDFRIVDVRQGVETLSLGFDVQTELMSRQEYEDFLDTQEEKEQAKEDALVEELPEVSSAAPVEPEIASETATSVAVQETAPANQE